MSVLQNGKEISMLLITKLQETNLIAYVRGLLQK